MVILDIKVAVAVAVAVAVVVETQQGEDVLVSQVAAAETKRAETTAVAGRVEPPREPDIGPRELVDDREHFHEMCVSRHWQSDELYRAHWSTMMLLAVLGGPPD